MGFPNLKTLINALGRALSPEDACSALADWAARAFKDGNRSVFFYVPSRSNDGMLVDVTGRARNQRFVPAMDGPVGRAFSLGEVQVEGSPQDGGVTRLACPVKWRGRVMGVLCVVGRRGEDLVDNLDMVINASDLAAPVIWGLLEAERKEDRLKLERVRNASLEDLSYKRGALIALLTQLGDEVTVEGLFDRTVDGLVAMGYQVASIVSRDRRGAPIRFRRNRGSSVSAEQVDPLIQEGRGLVGRVMRYLRPYLCEDSLIDPVVVRTEEDIRSELGVPIIGPDGYPWGMLRVGKRQPRALSVEVDGEILKALGLFIAMRIERSEVVDRLERELNRNRMLHRLVMSLRGASSLEEMADVVVRELSDSMGYGVVEFFKVEEEGPVELEILASSVTPKELLGEKSREIKRRGGGLVYRILRSRRMTNHRWVGPESGHLALVDAGTRHQLDVPVFAMGQMRGVLLLESPDEPFDGSDEEFFEVLSWHLGALLEGLEHLKLLELQSLKDPLTGLWNRKYLDARLEEELTRSARSGLPVCVAMVDLNNFKGVNDTYGHETGDMVLREVARVIRESVRSSDVVVRYGGDEFVVFSPGASQAEMMGLLDRVSRALSGMILCSCVSGLSFDFGVVCLEAGECLMSAVARADAEMYNLRRSRRPNGGCDDGRM
ncbi:diguanylate cyclase (GGDEF) domain-containing protein [Thermanaerovibrio velox DSM 12556]|uniref:Diguanylate cyclase (GGDEF) domain-containing protein n=1 Tax=Thermanaerovibrio velox DSM 12556 TaxID=926567 RepID=H0UN04_9BACT|nr:sensor domain-containing diguanylate cyclase [Thermanaerovibrio velox]EHM09283.1 diguanylate cyclase (GGDEF) domain-containing protein [Thermanaerovibrio velox DSM 12556]